MKRKLGIFLVCACLITTGCGGDSRVSSNLDSFTQVASNNNFVVNDIMNSYSGVTYITGAKKAMFDDSGIEMVIYDNEDNAKKAQEKHIDNFNTLKSTGASNKRDKGKNYYSYSLISNGYYMVSSRIDNTLVFSKVVLEDKEKIEKILDDLGY